VILCLAVGSMPASDGRKDRQTHDDNIYRASITSRGKIVRHFLCYVNPDHLNFITNR